VADGSERASAVGVVQRKPRTKRGARQPPAARPRLPARCSLRRRRRPHL